MYILKNLKLLPEATPWSMKPMGPWGVPTLLNSVFWGGLWGCVYAFVQESLPFATALEKGLAFGVLMAFVSNFTVLPLIKGKPLFMGFNIKLIASVLLILSGFGIATAMIFDALY